MFPSHGSESTSDGRIHRSFELPTRPTKEAHNTPLFPTVHGSYSFFQRTMPLISLTYSLIPMQHLTSRISGAGEPEHQNAAFYLYLYLYLYLLLIKGLSLLTTVISSVFVRPPYHIISLIFHTSVVCFAILETPKEKTCKKLSQTGFEPGLLRVRPSTACQLGRLTFHVNLKKLDLFELLISPTHGPSWASPRTQPTKQAYLLPDN